MFELDECHDLDMKVLDYRNHEVWKILLVLVVHKQAPWLAAFTQLHTSVPVKLGRVESAVHSLSASPWPIQRKRT